MAKEPPANILEFLTSIGTRQISHHAGRSLNEHLVSTWQLLTRWDLPDHVCVAGLCHSLYGTDAFETFCLGPEDRDGVRLVIGKEAERLSFLFGAMQRGNFLDDPSALKIKSRFDKSEQPISSQERRALCDILLANEMDLLMAKKGAMKPEKLAKKVGPIFEQIEHFLSPVAKNGYLDVLIQPNSIRN